MIPKAIINDQADELNVPQPASPVGNRKHAHA